MKLAVTYDPKNGEIFHQHNNTMTFFAVLIIFVPFRFLGTVYGLSFLFMPERNISALICPEYYLHVSTSMDSPKISIAFT